MDCLRLRTEGLSYDEIAAALDIQPGTVGALLNRARQKLEQTAKSPPYRGFLDLAHALRYLVLDALVQPSA
jgi:DNA-binding NarL/FixJ family response regulator